MTPPRRVAAGALAFLLHGAGVLALESVWVKQQVTLLGSSPSAPGLVLLAYFAGVAAGSWRWRLRGPHRIGSRAFVAGLALSVALSVAVPALLGASLPALSAHPWLSALTTRPSLLALSFLALGAPSAYIGAFYPAVARLASGRDFLPLYVTQTAGSLVGAVAGAVFLPRAWGYRATAVVAGGLLLAAVLVVRFARPAGGRGETDPARAGAPSINARLLLLAAGSGAFSLVLQALWIRLVALDSDNSVYAFGAVSALSIALFAGAGLLVTLLPARIVVSRRTLPILIPGIVAGAALAAWIWVQVTGGLAIRLVSEAEGFLAALGRAAPLVLVGSLGASLLFPLVLRLAAARHPPGDAVVGPLVAVNAAGCALGTVLSSFLLLPRAGIWPTLLAALAGYLLLLAACAPGRLRWGAAGAGAAVLVVLSPLRHPLVTPVDPFGGPPGTVVSAREGKYGIVSVIDYPERIRSLWLNNTYLLEAVAGDIGATVRLGVFPTVLHPDARSLAMIGVGTGMAASGLLDSGLTRIDLIELIPEVAVAARVFFGDANRNVLRDPRVRLIIEDGRRHLATTADSYDIVCTDLVTPWNEGSGALYSEEHFRSVRRRLNPGGMAVVWLPLYQLTRDEFLVIARTMAEVFPAVTLWQLGSRSDRAVAALVGADAISIEAIAAGISRQGPTAPEALRVHVSGILSHYIGPLELPGGPLRGVPVNTLDHPRLEFMAGRPGRALLRGAAFLELAEEIFRLPGNPGGRFFAGYDAGVEEWRLTGRDLNRYLEHLRRGEYDRAGRLEERIIRLPAFLEDGAPATAPALP